MFVIAASDRYILNKIRCSMSVAHVAAILKSAVFRFLKSHDKIRSRFKKNLKMIIIRSLVRILLGNTQQFNLI